jgi:hypothetical protein
VGVRRESLRRDSGRSASGPRLRRSRICGRGPRRGPSGSGRSKVPPGWVVCSRSRRTRPDAPWPVQGRSTRRVASRARPWSRIVGRRPCARRFDRLSASVRPGRRGSPIVATSSGWSSLISWVPSRRRHTPQVGTVGVLLITCPECVAIAGPWRCGHVLARAACAPARRHRRSRETTAALPPFQPLAGQMVADEVFL